MSTLTPDFLKEAAEKVNSEHKEAIEAASQLWFEHAQTVGQVLTLVQDQMQLGEWSDWIRENLDFTQHQANGYMRIYHFREDLRDMGELPATYTEAIAKLRWFPTRAKNARLDKEMIAKVKRWRAEGQSYRKIAEALGVNHQTVTYWLDPSAYNRKRSATKRHQQRNYEAKKALEREETAKAMRKFGGDVSQVYGLIRKALAQLDRVEPRDFRNHTEVNNAMAHLYRAEDSLVSVMRGGWNQ